MDLRGIVLGLRERAAVALRGIKSWWHRPPARPIRKANPLRGEELEQRWVPDTYRYGPGGGDPVWDNPTYWQYQDPFGVWNPCVNDYPGKVAGRADDVTLIGGHDTWLGWVNNSIPCTVNVSVSLHSLRVFDNYASTVTIASGKTITISGTDSLSLLNMTTTGAIEGSDRLSSKLILDGQANFEWYGGTLRNLTAVINPSANLNLATNPGVSPVMSDATIDVKGRVSWNSQSVAVTAPSAGQPKSLVHVQTGGTFNIRAAGQTWGGSDAAGNKYFDLSNEGTVTTDPQVSGVATVNGDYWTSGATTIGSGWTVDLLGKGEQSAGTFTLAGGTVKMSYPGQPLGIRAGTITGTGTVWGSLFLGKDNGQPDTNPVIAPRGTGGAMGQIAVTGNFTMSSGTVDVTIDGAAGNNPQADKVAVTGTAALAGSAVGTLKPNTRTPDAAIKIVFLTYGSRQFDFGSFGYPGPNPPWYADKDDPGYTRYWFIHDLIAIRGKVWQDGWVYYGYPYDGDGLQLADYSDSGMPGVVVHLLDATGHEVDVTTTDGSGNYQFLVGVAGTYRLKFDLPTTGQEPNYYYAFSPQDAGDNAYDGYDSDVDSSGYTDLFVVDLNESIDHLDAGVTYTENV